MCETVPQSSNTPQAAAVKLSHNLSFILKLVNFTS